MKQTNFAIISNGFTIKMEKIGSYYSITIEPGQLIYNGLRNTQYYESDYNNAKWRFNKFIDYARTHENK